MKYLVIRAVTTWALSLGLVLVQPQTVRRSGSSVPPDPLPSDAPAWLLLELFIQTLSIVSAKYVLKIVFHE